MYQTSDIKNGLKVEMDGYPWNVVYFQFVKPGKGTAFTRTKLKNLITGNVVERTFRSGETLAPADVSEDEMQYLFSDDDGASFMNTETYDQVHISKKTIGDDIKWLMEQMYVRVLFYKGNPVNIELPNFIEVEVTYTEPAVKGNTSTGATKAATLATGAEVQVPMFIDRGDVLKIDTREGEYVERVNYKKG
jgi:elongation factor P